MFYKGALKRTMFCNKVKKQHHLYSSFTILFSCVMSVVCTFVIFVIVVQIDVLKTLYWYWQETRSHCLVLKIAHQNSHAHPL